MSVIFATTLKFRLFALLLIITMPSVLILYGQFWDNKNTAIIESEEHSIKVIHQLTLQQQSQIAQITYFLQQLKKMPPLQSADHQLCSDFLTTMLKLIPTFSNLSMPELYSSLLCSAAPTKKGQSIKDSIYFQPRLQHKKFTLNEIKPEQMAKNLPGNFVYPVYKTANGDLIAAIVAKMSLHWWREALIKLDLPKGTEVYISDHNDNIIASHPYNPDQLGEKKPLSTTNSPAGFSDWFDFSLIPNRIQRSIIFPESGNNAVTISVKYPINAMRSQTSQTLYNRTLLFFAFSLLVLLLVLIQLKENVLFPLNQLTTATDNLLKGKLSPNIKNSNISELRILQQRFQQMASIRLQSENNAIKHNDQLKSVLNSLPDTYLKVSYDGNILSHEKLDAFMPIPAHQNMNISALLPEHITTQLLHAMRAQQTTQNLIWEFYLTRAGQQSSYEMRCAAVANEMTFVAILRDITLRKNNDAATQLAASVYRNSSEGMAITDASGFILDVNPAFSRLTQYSEKEIIGQSFSTLGSGAHNKAFYREMWEQISATGRWQGEIENRRKNGELFSELVTVDTVYNDAQNVHRYVAIFTDISASREADKLIWQQANFDSLTRLPNRAMLKDTLEKEIARAERRHSMMAMLLLDVDHFKDVNDTLGHAVGDQLLIEVARRLTSAVRKVDTVARLGGDEFVVLLSDINDLSDVNIIARNILESLAQAYLCEHNTIHVTASIGIALYPHDSFCIEDLLKFSDQAMYTAKAQGRNHYSFFTPAMQAAALFRTDLIKSLGDAIEQQQFILYYQPIIDLPTGKIVKAEALIRWLHPTKGTINPVDFIPLAEETRLINSLGKWIFTTALEQVQLIRQALNDNFQIALNISPIQFSSPDSGMENWPEQLLNAKVSGSAFVIEITEGLILDSGQCTQTRLSTLKSIGIELALDDFGSGYSSLSYLQALESHYLKIDRKFVMNISKGNEALLMCEAIIIMAHRLGIKVVAEGIETKSQRDLLIAAGCDFGQGYLFSKPLCSEQLLDLLSKNNNDYL